MSKYEWEAGTIKLPAAEFATVRKAVADAVANQSERHYQLATEFHRSLTPSVRKSMVAYAQALERFARTQHLSDRDTHRLREPLGVAYALPRGDTWKPPRITRSLFQFPTNKTLEFGRGGEGYIGFNRDSSTVTWSVSENNRAIEAARSGLLWQALAGALSRVRWTRDTGGVIVGNDEYNRDNEYDGGGSNYVTTGFGPVGAALAPYATDDYRMANGTTVRSDDFEKVQKAHEAAQRRRWANTAQGRTGDGRYTFKPYSDAPPGLL